MRFKTIIDKSGKITNEVIDREGQDCSNLLKITNSLGRQMSDERIGPDDDKVNEAVAHIMASIMSIWSCAP